MFRQTAKRAAVWVEGGRNPEGKITSEPPAENAACSGAARVSADA